MYYTIYENYNKNDYYTFILYIKCLQFFSNKLLLIVFQPARFET